VSWLSRLAVGMRVHATDGPLGSVASVPRVDLGDPSAPAEVIVLASQANAGPGVEEFLRVNRDMIDRIDGDTVYLNLARHDVPRASQSVGDAMRGLRVGEQHLTIPLVEEELDVERRVVELGYVQVHKKVEDILDERTVNLRHQQVEVDRVPVDRVIPEMIEPYMDGDVYVVPVIEEEVIVTRQLRLREELRIRRSVGEHVETLQTPFRRERVVVQEHWYDDAGMRSRVVDGALAEQVGVVDEGGPADRPV
jgi:uncharacterized protein (TIGR02271 family)